MEIKTDLEMFGKLSNLTKIGVSYDMNLQVGSCGLGSTNNKDFGLTCTDHLRILLV